MKSSTDGDGDEISLIFVLPVTDIELSRAVPRVNKNLKKKRRRSTGCGATAFQRISFNSRLCVYFLPLFFFFFRFIYFRHFSTTTILLSSRIFSACIKRGSRNWRGINASRKYRLETSSTIFFLGFLFRIKGESDFSNKQEGKFSVELEKFITEWKTFPLGLFIHSEELSSQRIFFFDIGHGEFVWKRWT